MELEKQTLVVVSTAHITLQDNEILAHHATASTADPPSVDLGYLLWLYGLDYPGPIRARGTIAPAK